MTQEQFYVCAEVVVCIWVSTDTSTLHEINDMSIANAIPLVIPAPKHTQRFRWESQAAERAGYDRDTSGDHAKGVLVCRLNWRMIRFSLDLSKRQRI